MGGSYEKNLEKKMCIGFHDTISIVPACNKAKPCLSPMKINLYIMIAMFTICKELFTK